MIRDYTLKLDLQPIKEYVISERKSTQLTAKKSNVGGYQSFIYDKWPEVLFGLRDFIQAQIPEQTFMTLWYNINGHGCYNEVHHHSLDDGYSGVFYIDVPDENMGNLYFEDGTEYEPTPNRLILFPSDLKHGVKTNLSHKKRISMSFNYLKHTDKEPKDKLDQFFSDNLKSGIII